MPPPKTYKATLAGPTRERVREIVALLNADYPDGAIDSAEVQDGKDEDGAAITWLVIKVRP